MAEPTKFEMLEAIDEWEADPDGVETCDLLCWVADCLDLDEGEYGPEKLRELIDARDLDD